MRHFVIVGVLIAVLTPLVYIGLAASNLMPVEASAQSLIVDQMWDWDLMAISFLFAIIVVPLAYSLIVFRRRKGDTTDGVHEEGNSTLEITWTIVPLMLVTIYAYLGAYTLGRTRLADPNALVKAGDGGPVFYCQWRVGLHGRRFRICKFRTMTPLAEGAGPQVTSDGDPRVTRIGRFLRKTKFDELPQLWNVLKGEMSLVGPRPEVPRYVAYYTPGQRSILNLKPGITARAALYFREEELLLKQAENVEEFYVKHCLPRKLQLDMEYAARANLLSDTWIIFRTICPYRGRAAAQTLADACMEPGVGV